VAVRVFPVDPAGKPTFGSTYGAARPGGRSHDGEDIFAPEGTPVRAVDDGHVRYSTNTLGGNVAYLTTADGTYYFAHLSRFEGEARQVKAGDVIAFVGHTGNASQTPPHLHFAIYPPGGGGAVDPYEALRAVQPGHEAAPGVPGARPPVASPRGSNAGIGWLVLLWALSKRRG
jgi:murein DD-endopeptidase MepM/ murein hydrolase activator NlpD